VTLKASLRSCIFSPTGSSLIHNVSSPSYVFLSQSVHPISDRMPPQIGEIISKNVYDNKLLSFDKHPVTSAEVACHFIDVVGGIGVTPPTGGTSSIVSLYQLLLSPVYSRDGFRTLKKKMSSLLLLLSWSKLVSLTASSPLMMPRGSWLRRL
jgi:hypothetical protein